MYFCMRTDALRHALCSYMGTDALSHALCTHEN